jgi:hypothetical protein
VSTSSLPFEIAWSPMSTNPSEGGATFCFACFCGGVVESNRRPPRIWLVAVEHQVIFAAIFHRRIVQ